MRKASSGARKRAPMKATALPARSAARWALWSAPGSAAPWARSGACSGSAIAAIAAAAITIVTIVFIAIGEFCNVIPGNDALSRVSSLTDNGLEDPPHQGHADGEERQRDG